MINVGQWITVKVPIGIGLAEKEKMGRVAYVNEKHGWFMVEFKSVLGYWRSCFRLPSTNAPEMEKEHHPVFRCKKK